MELHLSNIKILSLVLTACRTLPNYEFMWLKKVNCNQLCHIFLNRRKLDSGETVICRLWALVFLCNI